MHLSTAVDFRLNIQSDKTISLRELTFYWNMKQ